MRKIQTAGFSVALQPSFSREYLFGDSIIRCSCAKERIGSEGDYSNMSIRQKVISNRWYTRLIPSTEKQLMELERNAEFMRGLGLKDFLANVPELPAQGMAPAEMNLKDYYVIFPGAGAKIRQWPESRFREIARRIYRATGWVGVICGGPGEEVLGRNMEEDIEVPLQNWIGRTSLQELTAIIAGAHILVGNETSAVHIAAAVSTPAVCILGGGHFGRFMPYRIEAETDRPIPVAVTCAKECFGCGWKCVNNVPPGQASPCIENISVDEVWKTVIKVLLITT